MPDIEGFREIAEKLRRSTVFVSAGRRGQGSGIIVQSDGMIVTNSHVAAFEPIRVQLWDGTRAEAGVLKRDSVRDEGDSNRREVQDFGKARWRAPGIVIFCN